LLVVSFACSVFGLLLGGFISFNFSYVEFVVFYGFSVGSDPFPFWGATSSLFACRLFCLLCVWVAFWWLHFFNVSYVK
jgi:hypothetical protein